MDARNRLGPVLYMCMRRPRSADSAVSLSTATFGCPRLEQRKYRTSSGFSRQLSSIDRRPRTNLGLSVKQVHHRLGAHTAQHAALSKAQTMQYASPERAETP